MKHLMFAIFVGMLGTGIFLSLGIWQVQRLAWKEALLAEITQKVAAAPVSVPATPRIDTENLLSVSARGTLGFERIRVLVSQKQKGAGYRIISALQMEDRRILVDRGFVFVSKDIPPPPEGEITVTGNLLWPQETDRFTPPPDLSNVIWFARDVAGLANRLGTEPVLLVAREIIPQENGIEPLPVSTAMIPNNHLQYAITWFSLAVIWVVMSAYFLYRQHLRPS